jgi:hypothetical protein
VPLGIALAWKNKGDSKFSCKFSTFRVGLSNGKISAYGRWICNSQNYHYYGNGSDHCSVSGNKHILEWPNNAEWNGKDDVVGCGLVLSPKNQLAIFFTGNGTLIGQFLLWKLEIPIV